MNYDIKITPPTKQWQMLELALADLAKVKADPRYEIHMLSWHNPTAGRELCEVCLAGAVMAKTCNVPIEEFVDWSKLSVAWKTCFCTINGLRLGIYRTKDGGEETFRPANGWGGVSSYDRDKFQWHDDMLELLEYLKLRDL